MFLLYHVVLQDYVTKELFDYMGKRPSKVSHQSAMFRDRGSGDIMWSYKTTWSSDPVKICGWQVAPW